MISGAAILPPIKAMLVAATPSAPPRRLPIILEALMTRPVRTVRRPAARPMRAPPISSDPNPDSKSPKTTSSLFQSQFGKKTWQNGWRRIVLVFLASKREHCVTPATESAVVVLAAFFEIYCGKFVAHAAQCV
jgi:hypothetical protein